MSEPLWCPFSLTVDPVTRFLNGEFVDHPVYDGFELQWFDDDSHGRGMLAFLSRREDRRVDYYVEPGLQLDRGGYEIGGGTGRWVETRFGTARLDVDRGGVHAEVGFLDVDGRTIEIRVDDREAGPRRGADLLAPVGAGIQHPASLLLVYLHGFDLVRRAGRDPVIRISGRDVATGRLPGAVLHRRHLVKAAAPLSVAMLCRATSGPLSPVDPAAPGPIELEGDRRAVRGLTVERGGASACLQLAPAFPQLADLAPDVLRTGAWRVTIDRATITGGAGERSAGQDASTSASR